MEGATTSTFMVAVQAQIDQCKDTSTLLSMVQEHVDAGALDHVAGRVVCGVAAEGDPGQRRTRQVRRAGNCKFIFFFFKVTLLLFFVATEVCRLRWNWFYLILVVSLNVIDYSSPLPSFHQFVTNPTAQQLNGGGKEHEVYCYRCLNLTLNNVFWG